MNKRSIVFLATKTNEIDRSLIELIERKYGANTKINFVRSPKVYSAKNGLADKVRQYENCGIVLAIQGEITDQSLEVAATTGIPFGVLFKNNSDNWEGFLVGTSPKSQKKVAVNA
ncbi:MAG: hypothetical protein ACYC3G_02100 [Minisyncoccota bacterium]